MPATDGLQPPLQPAEKQIVKDYGGWTNFMQVHGLRPTDQDDIREAHAIVRGLAQQGGQNGKR